MVLGQQAGTTGDMMKRPLFAELKQGLDDLKA
jgi:hypothetical protein